MNEAACFRINSLLCFYTAFLHRMTDRKREIRITFLIIGLCLGSWALFHIIGGYIGGLSGSTGYPVDIRRSLIIAAFFTIFLGGWYLLVRKRFGKKD